MPNREEGGGSAHVKSVERAIRLINLLAEERRELPLSEIASRLGWPKTTAYGILATLRDYQFVEQSTATGHYGLGARLFELGSEVARGWNIREAAGPVLQRLNRKLGETVQLATEKGGEVLYIEKLESTHMLRIVSETGARLPMHCSGLGKVLLAYKTPGEVAWILRKHGMPRMTERTITDREVLERELIRVRRDGSAMDDQEIMEGLRCIAAPIWSADGQVKYAVSISGLAMSLQGERLDFVREELLQAAGDISRAMGYRQTGEQPDI